MKICLQLHISNEIIPIKTQNNKNSGKKLSQMRRDTNSSSSSHSFPWKTNIQNHDAPANFLHFGVEKNPPQVKLKRSCQYINVRIVHIYVYMYKLISCHMPCKCVQYIYIYSVTSCTMQPLCKWFQKELKGTSNDTGFPLRSYFLGDLFRSWGHLLRARIIMRVDGKKILQYHWAFE